MYYMLTCRLEGKKILLLVIIHSRMYPWLLVTILLLGCISATDTSTELLSFKKQLPKYTESESFSQSASDRFTQFKYVVTIDPLNTRATNDTCLILPHVKESPVLCKSLDDALQLYHGLSSVLFYLAAHGTIYRLSFTNNVTNQHNISFYGNSSLSSAIPTIKCFENVGFSFINSSNISISNIEFINCGSAQNSTSRDFTKLAFHLLTIKAGLYFYNCTDVSMHQVQVLNGSQAIGVVMYDTDGKVEICNSTFANNSVRYGNHSGGGGFAVEFTYCKPGDNTCNNTYDLYRRNQNSMYSFHNCIFLENRAIDPARNHSYNIKVSRKNHDATGQGGGLSIHIKGDAKNNSFVLSGCQFLNNTATWGGGLHIEMDDDSTNNSITISCCNFSNNSAVIVSQDQQDRYTGGGAIDIIAVPHDQSRLHIKDCKFTNNWASEGGAIYFSIARQTNFNQSFDVVIAGSLFESNEARLGSAMVITNFPIFPTGYLPEIHIYDCTFLSNHHSLRAYPSHAAGLAVVYVSQIPVSFHNSVIFSKNLASALAAVGTLLNFTDVQVANFSENNSGGDGGAIALLGDTTILIGPDTCMIFVGNSAAGYGGAIYNRDISKEQLKSTADCFLRYIEPLTEPDDWTAHFNFSGNKAHLGGCSIFTTSLFPCTWNSESNLSKPFHWKYWHYDQGDITCKHGEIFTEPDKFNSSVPNSSLLDTIPVYPGHAFTLPLLAYDDLSNNVTNDTIYSAQMLDEHSKSVAKVEPGFTYVASNYISILGKPGSNIKLRLQTEGSRTVHVVLNMTIQNCPPGFVCGENNIDCQSADLIAKCQCPTEEYTYRGNLKCSTRRFSTKIDLKYWYGLVYFKQLNKNLSLMGRVPLSYVDIQSMSAGTVNLPRNSDEVDKTICGNLSRTGVLCGECIEGFAVSINSQTYECVPCNSTAPGEFIKLLCAYIVLTYLPIMVFFLLIIFLDIKLASSAAAGFVLYAQTVSVRHFLYPEAPHGAGRVIQTMLMTIYGIFNLESFAFLMHPFCLNKNFTTLHKYCLDYVIAVFPLVMIVVIYLLYKCKVFPCKCRNKQKRTGLNRGTVSRKSCCKKPSLIHAFTAFMLLSYTKFGQASMKTVFITELFDAQGTTKDHRILMAGQLSFTDHKYLFPFGILAILVLVFIVFLPPLLLLGPIQFVDWLADKPKFGFIHRYWPSITIHTFLDTFQGYKPNRRFFAGLYLLFRLARLLIYSFAPDLFSIYTIQLVITLIFLVLVSLLRPYANEKYNYLDTLLFLNLGILNVLTIFMNEHKFIASIHAVESVLVSLPLIYMFCYLIWSKIQKRKHYKIVKESISRRLTNPVRFPRDETEQLLNSGNDDHFGESIDYSSDDPDEGLFQRAARGNHFRAASIETHPPGKPGGVHKSVVSIEEPQMPTSNDIGEEGGKNTGNDSGIGRQSNERLSWSNT